MATVVRFVITVAFEKPKQRSMDERPEDTAITISAKTLIL